MRIIEQLVYKISGDNSEFDKSLAKSDKGVNKFGSVAKKIFAGVTVAAVTMAVKKLGDMVIATAQATDRVDKMSQKIGLSRTAFQEWDFILSQSGASVDGLQQSMKALATQAEASDRGVADSANMFKKLGVDIYDVNGQIKDQETLFEETFKALADYGNEAERTAMASKLLGRAGTELIPAMNGGAESIEKMRQEAHTLGLVMSDELIDYGVVLTDNIDKLKRSYVGWKNEALSPLLGIAVSFTDKILGQTSASKDLNTQLTNLITTNNKYMLALDSVGESIEGVTDASLEQLAVQRDIQLFELEDTYFKSQKELAKLNEIIRINSDINTRNNKTLDDMAKKYGVSRIELARMAQAEQISTDDRDRHKDATDAVNESYRKYADAANKATSATINQKQFVDALAQAHVENNLDISRFIELDSDLYEQILASTVAYKENREEIEKRNEAIERARTVFKAYSDVTEDGLRQLIEAREKQKESAYNTEIIRLATEKLNEVLAEKARLAETEAEKEEARAEIIANTTKAISDAEKVSIALGDAYDLTSAKAGIFTSAIETLIESGLSAEDKAVADLIAQLKALQTTTKEVTNTSVESFNSESEARKIAYDKMAETRMSDKEKAFKAIQKQADAYLEAGVSIADVAKWQSEQIQKYQDEQTKKAQEEADKQKAIEEEKTRVEQEELDKRNQAILEAFNQSTKTRADAYKLLESYSLSEKDKALANIQAQADKFLEAGVSIVDVAEWQKNELARLQEEQADKAEEEAEKVRKVWTDTTLGILGSVSTIWGSINKVQANQNQSEIQRIEEQNKATLESARLRGASEEELTELEKSLQSDLNETKNQYAKEESERKKAQATFSAIIDTASAIIGFLANPGGWAGWALSAGAVGIGAAQLAAINSAPVPSYDVGSIRIPETQTATVHKDEMILTAPQAEQARREGITIAPNKASGNSVNLVIYLDGKEIARNTIDNLNSGSVGTIRARVVK